MPRNSLENIDKLCKNCGQLLVFLVGRSVPTGLDHQLEYLSQHPESRLIHLFDQFGILKSEDIGGNFDHKLLMEQRA